MHPLPIPSRLGPLLLSLLLALTAALAGCGEAVEVGSRAPRACTSDAACDDGVFCNGAERCAPNAADADELGCAPSAPLALDDGDPCTDDRCVEADGRVAHDRREGCQAPACTRDGDCPAPAEACRGAVCDAGACVTHDAPVGAACDDGIGCTDDACDAAGGCVGTPIDSVCFDADYCNGLEECRPERADADEDGCVPGVAPVPEDDGIACTRVVCDEADDTVGWAPGPDCACDVPGQPCDDPDPGDCTVFRCTDALTCEAEPLPTGAGCDDGVACTTGDTCDADGACGGAPDDAACDDSLYCNGAESCAPDMDGSDARGCAVGRPPVNPDGLDCTTDLCDEDTDRFTYVPTDACVCVTDADCAPATPNACLAYACVATRCEVTPAPVNTPCNDGLDCTTDDVCDALGVCGGALDDLACNDGLWCNGVEACRPAMAAADARGCAHRTAPPLTDGVACTNDRCAECDPTVGCTAGLAGQIVHDPAACACQTDDDCVGQEVGPCEAFTCAPRTFECVLGALAPGSACDDGLDCTDNTTCGLDGLCLGTPHDDACDDGLFCNGAETCAPDGWSADSGLEPGCAAGDDPTDTWPDTRLCLDLSCDEAADQVLADTTRCDSCMDVPLYTDADADGFGADDAPTMACLLPDEAAPGGLSRDGGDCGPTDPWRNPDAEEICGDWLDDDCDDADAPCPTTSAALVIPTWSCGAGAPPSNVYAWARLPDNNGHYANGSCLVFFAAPSGAFFVAPKLTATTTRHCTSFDERLYAFTLAGPTAACAPITIEADFSGRPELAMQPVSNDCRKFLHALVRGGDVSYVASTEASMERRIDLFGTLEVACSGYRGWPYGWQSLMTAPIERNPGFVAP